MFETIRESASVQNSVERLVAIVDARSAAEAAAQIAQAVSGWATRTDLVIDDATEVWAAAGRARQAAERAEIAPTVEEARAAARAAWAAMTTAQEAEARVTATIVDSLIAPPIAA
jgi:hypothetical protein